MKKKVPRSHLYTIIVLMGVIVATGSVAAFLQINDPEPTRQAARQASDSAIPLEVESPDGVTHLLGGDSLSPQGSASPQAAESTQPATQPLQPQETYGL